MSDYNIRYYNLAVKALQDMTHYSGDLIEDCAQYLLRYFPQANINELKHAVNWALADTWSDGCEIETI